LGFPTASDSIPPPETLVPWSGAAVGQAWDDNMVIPTTTTNMVLAIYNGNNGNNGIYN